MDLDHLERLILKIDLKPDTINSITDYCILNSKSIENDIANVIHKSFPTHYSQKMLAILKLVSQIFLKTNMAGIDRNDRNRFFKPLAPKAKVYIEQISKRVKQIKPQHLKIVPQILADWSRSQAELFAFSFMDKLKKIAEPIYIAANKYEQENKNKMFDNYSKTFLMQYQDVKSFEPTSRIFDDYVQFDKISTEIGQINTEMKKLGLQKMTPQMSQRASELRKKLQKFTDKLQDIICKYHVDFKILREACKEEFDRLPAEAKEIMEKNYQ